MIDMDKLYKQNMAEYMETFVLQKELQEKEIGCYLPFERYGSYRILLKAVVLPDKRASGIIIPENIKEDIIKKYDIGLVIGAGPECYMDREKFPSGPRLKIGDWIDVSSFQKEKKIFNNHLCYIVTDDRVNIPVPDVELVVSELRSHI